MLRNLREETKQMTRVKRKRIRAETMFPFRFFMVYFIKKRRRRNMMRTRATLT